MKVVSDLGLRCLPRYHKKDNRLIWVNSFLARGVFCHLIITFANSLDPDQDRQNVGPDLDPNSVTH